MFLALPVEDVPRALPDGDGSHLRVWDLVSKEPLDRGEVLLGVLVHQLALVACLSHSSLGAVRPSSPWGRPLLAPQELVSTSIRVAVVSLNAAPQGSAVVDVVSLRT